MRNLLPLLTCLFCASCGAPPEETASEVPQPPTPPEEATGARQPVYDQVWIMRGWQGYMGAVLALRGDAYDYWFYSDAMSAEDGAAFPCRGTFEKTEDGIILSDPEKGFLYSRTWVVVTEREKPFLAATDDAGTPSGRWLKPVDPMEFDPSKPFLLQAITGE